MTRGSLLPLPTPAWTRALLAPALVFIATAIDRNYQTDLWHHLARGREMVERGGLLDTDLFTYTVSGQHFQDTNWLSQLLFYRFYCRGGLELIQVVNSSTLAAMMGVLVWLCWRSSRSLLLSAAVAAGAFFGLWQLLIIRPQTFSLLLFVLLYAVLELADPPHPTLSPSEGEGKGRHPALSSKRRRRWLLLLAPCIMALWVNLHGGFPVGLVLIGAYVLAAVVEGWWHAGREVVRDRGVWGLGLALAGSVLATLANPYSWRVYQYVGLTSATAAARRIDEWVPPSLDQLTGKALVVSVLLLLVLLALPGRRPRVRDVCLMVCFLPSACGSVRMVAWWLLVVAPIAAGLLAARLPARFLVQEPERPSPASAASFAAIVLAVVLCVPGLERFNPLWNTVRSTHRTEDDLEQMCDRLAGESGGRILSRFEWSEYLGWRLAPRYTVFMDGRIEIFPDNIWLEYSALTRGRADWEEILDRYHVDYLLLDKAGYHAQLLPQVARSPSWQPVFEAGDSVLFVRRQSKLEIRNPKY
jgi:hypothetical protein